MAAPAERDASEEILARARHVAADMRAAGGDVMDGMLEQQALVAAAGYPAARTLLRALAVHSRRRKSAELWAALGAIDALFPADAQGCLEVAFAEGGAPRVARLHLAPCGPDHDLGAQLAPLQRHFDAEGWKGVLAALSQLVFLGRNVYQLTLAQRADLASDICGSKGIPPQYRATRVDPENTTLFLDPAWKERVGIFVAIGSGAAGPAP